MDFAFYIRRVMVVTDSQPKSDPNVIFEELDEILDRIIIISPFSFIDLKKEIKRKYTESIRINEALSNIFRRLNNSVAKWMVRTIIKNYNPIRIPETLAIY
jgi:DNA ligase-4